MHVQHPWRLPLVALLVLLSTLLGARSVGGMQDGNPRPSAAPAPVLGSAAPVASVPAATPATLTANQRGAGRVGQSPTLLGDINNDGIVDIRDYGIWRQQFGATDCGNPADLNADCIVHIRDYGVWRQNFGQTGPTVTPTPTTTPTATPTLLGRAYVANVGSTTVSVIDTTTNTVVGAPIPVGSSPEGMGVDPTVHRAFVPNFFSNNVSVIDTTSNTVVGAPIPVGSGPGAVGIGP
jgi:YVTN family beta-propeller protein